MTTSEDSTQEEVKGGDDIQDSYLIYLSNFELLEWLINIFYSPLLLFLLFYDVIVALGLAWEGEWLEMESEDKLQPMS